MDYQIKDFKKKYKKIENTLDIRIIFKNDFIIFFYTKNKSIYRTYFYIEYLGIIISYKNKNNITIIQYFYNYVHKINKKFKL